MKIYMAPLPVASADNGIMQVVKAYHAHLPKYGITFVDKDAADLVVGHAGILPGADIVHCHGLNWTGDYELGQRAYSENADVVRALRLALGVTVPSDWVAETLRRDMHLSPAVIGHGINLEEWEPLSLGEYALWNKNRWDAICDPTPIMALAPLSALPIVSTFGHADFNLTVTGNMPHAAMRDLIRSAKVYLATTKETFGIGTLEALAAGVPVLGYNWGGTAELVHHKESGYLVEPGDVEGLAKGLRYCLRHRAKLSACARETAKAYTWDIVADRIARFYRETHVVKKEPAVCSIVIPCHNKVSTVERAMSSAFNQTAPVTVTVVDDLSTDESYLAILAARLKLQGSAPANPITVIPLSKNVGVAAARNVGWQESYSKYVCFLDADDYLAPNYIATCVAALETDASLGIAYTGLGTVHPDSTVTLSSWPGEYNFNLQLMRRNQVPTCCVVRRSMLVRTGGYRSMYAPAGAGCEDAELWLRAGALGYGARKVSPHPLFLYQAGAGATSKPGYRELDWTAWHPWCRDGKHPVGSLAGNRNGSHPAYQYDRPEVSVMLEGTMYWMEQLTRSCDSLEAQTFRNWEVIYYGVTVPHLPFLRHAAPRAKRVLRMPIGEWLPVDALAQLAALPVGLYRYESYHLWRQQ